MKVYEYVIDSYLQILTIFSRKKINLLNCIQVFE